MSFKARREFTDTRSKRTRTSVIRESLVALTGNSRLARILDQFLYWSERLHDIDAYLWEEHERCTHVNQQFNVNFSQGWIYKSAEELIDEIMLDESPQTIRKDIIQLVEWGYLHQRNNPRHKWDRTLQYRVDLQRVREDLQTLGYPLSEYRLLSALDDGISVKNRIQGNLQNGVSKVESGDSKINDGRAIPETTLEITLEKAKETDSHVEKSNVDFSSGTVESSPQQPSLLPLSDCAPVGLSVPNVDNGSRKRTTNELKPPRAKKEAHPNTQPIMDAYIQALGRNPANYAKESAAAKRMAEQGYSPAQVAAVYQTMKASAFYSDKFLSLLKVHEQIGEVYPPSRNGSSVPGAENGNGSHQGATKKPNYLTPDNLYT